MQKRQYVRLDSVFPVEFQLIDNKNMPLTDWNEGFTCDISKGGLCLNAAVLDKAVIELITETAGLRLNLKIHIPPFTQTLARGSVAWVKKENDCFLIGIRYENIDDSACARIWRFTLAKVIIPKLALAAITGLFLVSLYTAFNNAALSLINRKLAREMRDTLSEWERNNKRLGQIRKEKSILEEELIKSQAALTELSQELDIKTKKLSEELGKTQVELRELSRQRDSEIEGLAQKLGSLENEKAKLKSGLENLQREEKSTILKIERIQEKKNVLEKKSFQKMYEWLKAHQNLRLGLIASFEGDKGLVDQAFSYDQALGAIAFSYFKDFGNAAKILDFYANRTRQARWFYNAYYASTGEPAEFIIHSGPNIWIGIAALQYTFLSADEKYLPLAKSVAERILSLQKEDVDSGIKGGPKDEWFSTEHNLDGFAFFNMLNKLYPDEQYKKAAEQILAWLKNHAYDHPQVPIRRGKGDATIATDTYAWSIAAVGPQALLEMGMDPEDIIKFAEDNCAVEVDYGPKGDNFIKIKGFDFAKPENIARGGIISTEWTAQMALAYKIIGNFFAAKDDSKKSLYQDRAELYLGELAKMIITSSSPTGQGQGCLPYASHDSVSTGHGWSTPRGKTTGSVAATAYAIFAYYGLNPLELK